jgi:fumarate reductase subunit D
MMKPGVKTSEFYLTVVFALIGVLVALGVISQEQAETLSAAIVQAVTAGAGLIVAVLPIWKYIDSRTKLKSKNDQ